MEYTEYGKQRDAWPRTGRHIMAYYDDSSIAVYQAYHPGIAGFAEKNQYFGGGGFGYSRMSWIKPNFLWMMYRAGWARKEGQERILRITLGLTFFEEILEAAVESHFDPDRYISREDWNKATETSDVRLQWDPDHDPAGRPLERKAIQLGLRGGMLKRYGRDEIIKIEDITGFVVEQREKLDAGNINEIMLPLEREYIPSSQRALKNIGLV